MVLPIGQQGIYILRGTKPPGTPRGQQGIYIIYDDLKIVDVKDSRGYPIAGAYVALIRTSPFEFEVSYTNSIGRAYFEQAIYDQLVVIAWKEAITLTGLSSEQVQQVEIDMQPYWLDSI